MARDFPDRFEVVALAAGSNVEALERQIAEFKPSVAALREERGAAELRKRVNGSAEILAGEDAAAKIAREADYDVFVGAAVGFAGLLPVVEAIRRGKRVALANKEALVVAGELISNLARETGAEILPVDSEHSAIFQCLLGEEPSHIRKIILTASGGPFREKSLAELERVTVAEALEHPTWNMGAKITVDSATMMNKGLEVIEARWLFDVPPERIEAIVHPQSIVHSMVEFVDGSIKAQLSEPDMKLPIQLALAYPDRLPCDYAPTDFAKIGTLEFFEPDVERFPCLRLAYDALAAGGTAPCALNAANEAAVARFLKGEIGFLDVPVLVRRALDAERGDGVIDVETIFECDRRTRTRATELAV